MRVTPDCEPQGSAFYISQAANLQVTPDITFKEGNYFAVWSDFRGNCCRIYGARVSPAGTVLDPGGIAIGPADNVPQRMPLIAGAGDELLVVWAYTDSTAPYRIMGRLVAADGGSLGDTATIALPAGAIRNAMAIETSGANILLAWIEQTGPTVQDLKALLLSNAGLPVGSPVTVASDVAGYTIGLCYDGANYLATYFNRPASAVYGRKIDLSGNPVGSSFRVSNGGNLQQYCDVVPGANNRYFNAWSEYGLATYSFDVRGNLDVPITGVAEAKSAPAGELRLRSRIVRDAIVLDKAVGVEALVFDAGGKKVGETRTGSFDCRRLPKGVFFVKIPSTGGEFKVIKI